MFNEPSSLYNNDQIPLINLLRPFPQFDGQFSALTLLGASASYNSLQVRFQKRASHYVSFEGNYTWSKAIDDSSAGANSFITDALTSGRRPQEPDNLRAERSISANDATQRMVLAAVVGVPVGRGLWIGHDMNRVLDAIVGAYSLNRNGTDQIAGKAADDHVYGIEVDNDIPGRYESFLDPAAKLKVIRTVAEQVHKANNKVFVYVAGTECITANADKSAHTVLKDHPDWIQRKITGEPAVFTGGAAFWIRPGDEDVWITPCAKEWRTQYMQRVREIAATGIDGIYVDIPYWMTHFDGWEQSWASFDDYTVAAFREKTGLDAKKDVKLGDFQDINFRKWIDFRIETMTNFVKEIRENARSVNPDIMLIPEIYPGIEEEAPRVGADVYEMYDVVDVIAPEYEFGNGQHMAASRSQVDWFLYQAGMLSFRAFAQGKASWILNYSWDGEKGVTAPEPMKNLANSIVMAGANFWDAPGHSMAGSNDLATWKLILGWIEKNEQALYSPRMPLHPIGVYFSPKSRDYNAKEFLPSYRGALVLLIQQHRPLQVVTPRTLARISR